MERFQPQEPGQAQVSPPVWFSRIREAQQGCAGFVFHFLCITGTARLRSHPTLNRIQFCALRKNKNHSKVKEKIAAALGFQQIPPGFSPFSAHRQQIVLQHGPPKHYK